MAARGTAKWYSVKHEEYIARMFDGERSASSGAAEHDAGDVRCAHLLIECKVKMPAKHGMSKPLPKFVQDLEKVAKEAFESGKDPMLALRYYAPKSILANPDGWIDLSVRRACDDADREATYTDAKAESDEEQAGQDEASPEPSAG